MKFSRRRFIQSIPFWYGVFTSSGSSAQTKKPMIMTVLGPIDPNSLGITLPHEHILVDFVGAKLISPDRWNKESVTDVVLPFLDQVKSLGGNTLIECTPNYLGRDVTLLKDLSQQSGVHILTNTGYYGVDEKYLPDHALTEPASTLAAKWVNEWKLGIDGTGIKPGFIKIGVNPGVLTDVSMNLVHAAAETHLKTGLTICSHTGIASSAFVQLDILKKSGVHPSAFVWVHAQTEKDNTLHVKAAKEGAWISLDGLNDDNVPFYVDALFFLKTEKCLDRVLVSHDAGWYDPSKPGGGEFRNFSTLFKKLIPALEEKGFTDSEVTQLIKQNPMNAFMISIRRFKK
jgi:phosphotriesterase-related protein